MVYCTLHNPTKTPRVIHDGIPGSQKKIPIGPNETTEPVEIALHIVETLRARRNTLIVNQLRRPDAPAPVEIGELIAPEPAPAPGRKPPIVIQGMWGIGDNLHQRAFLRELMKTKDVWLETCFFHLYHDMIPQGLHIIPRRTRLRAQAKIIAQEESLHGPLVPLPANAPAPIKIWYYKTEIDRQGSILAEMMHRVGVKVPRPDFSMPVPDEWRATARALISGWKTSGKPILLYRPIVLRKEWDGAARNPDPLVYQALFRSIRDRFFVVSLADLEPGVEWIVGPDQAADVKLHHAELDFRGMAGLFAEVDMAFCCAGMGPVLAQAVGTPVVIVYGGRESFKTTESAGAHLAPTLGLDPNHPCDCHSHRHACDKRMTLAPALGRLRAFVDEHTTRRRTLIFATTYVDCRERAMLTDQWITLVKEKNPWCDILIVDAKSPWSPLIDEKSHGRFIKYTPGRQSRQMLHVFDENVGHLSRGGKDGWGRAFTFGLQAAIDCGYDFVAHIEGDSLFRLPVGPIIDQMAHENVKAMSIPVVGMTVTLRDWVETGLMFFETAYLRESKFVEKYDWKARTPAPTPEKVVRALLGDSLVMASWKGMRGDKGQITHKNVDKLDLDWITHCHTDVWAYDRFLALALGRKEVVPSVRGNAVEPLPAPDVASQRPIVATPAEKLNFGCGTNKLPGWRNMDIEVDIEKPLPFADHSASIVFSEHCVEHVDYYAAIRFFQEAWRVLKPGGVIRIAVPSIEKIMESDDAEYWKFSTKFQTKGPTKRGAMHGILFSHGHKTGWTSNLLRATLYYAGFEDLTIHMPGESFRDETKNLEGHDKVIGKRFNDLETIAVEGVKPDPEAMARMAATVQPIALPSPDPIKLAIVVGGGNDPIEEAQQAALYAHKAGLEPTYFIVNDMIAHFPHEAVAVTLHREKLEGWMQTRVREGLPLISQVWGHRKYDRITNVTEDWSGSSGLFAVKIARMLGFTRIILAGVPMTADGNHFVRKVRWNAVQGFRRGWERHKDEIAPYVRSVSGWTAEQFGKPTEDFLRGKP